MFSFRGEFKRQRDINLGGRRRNDTARSNAQSVLEKAHEEREKRELERRRQIAASTIQRLSRGWRDTARWRQQMREQLDISVFKDANSSLERLYISLRDFTVYYNSSPEDIERLHMILRALFMPRAGDGSTYDVWYLHILETERTQIDDTEGNCRRMWTVLISRLFRFALKVPKDGILRVDVDLVLGTLTNAITLDKTVASEMCLLMKNLIELHGLYPFLSRCLSEETVLGSRAIENAVRLAVMPLSSGPLQRLAMASFVWWLLALPGLPNRIGVQGVTVIAKADVDWRALVDCVYYEMTRQQQQQQHRGDKSIQFGIFGDAKFKDIALSLAAINIIGNMSAFVLPRLSRGETLAPLDVGYIEACFACAQVVPSCDLFSSEQSTVTDGVASQIVKAIDAHALKWLKSILSTQVLGLLVRVGCIDSMGEYCMHAHTAQRLLLIFVQRWGKTASSTAIDNVFRVVDIRTVGWRAILQDRQFLEQFGGDHVGVDTIKSHDLSKLHLLCEVFNRQLQTIGDNELFERGMSLPLDEIKVIARVSRNIAFALYWTQESSDELVHIRDSAAALTRRLFIRNSRHQFVDKGFWHMPSSLLDMASFVDRVAEDPMFLVKDKEIDSDDLSSEASESDLESDSDVGEAMNISRAGIRAPDHGLDWMVDTYSRISRQHQSHAEQRILTPRIAVLRNIPFVVPFNDRVGLLHTLINRDRSRLGLSSIGDTASPEVSGMFRSENVVVRRGNVFEDGFRSIFPVLSGKPVAELDDDADTEELPRQQSAGRIPGPRPGTSGSATMHGIDTFNNGDDMLEEDNEGMQSTGGWSNWMDNMDSTFPRWRGSNEAFAFRNAVGGLTGSQPSQQDMFKYRMRITFMDQHGAIEEGIDGGGLFKEFLVSLVHEAFDPCKELFCQTEQNNIYPNPSPMPTDPKRRRLMLDKYKFLGAIIGKALYEGVLVDVSFALFFLGYCVGQHPEFNDLQTFDQDLYKGLVFLKNHPVSTQPDANADGDYNDGDDEIFRVYHMHFSVTTILPNGQTKEYPLVPGGENIKVTSRNRQMYLNLVAEYMLSKQIKAQVEAFMEGLHTVIPENWLRLLFASPLEFSQLLCGDSSAIDIADWQRNTVYSGEFGGQGYSHRVVQDFWHVVDEDLTEEERRKLCGFATSCERPPLLGFRELNPRFCISGYSHDPEGGTSIDDRLPSASTCVNLLKLPVYSSRKILHRKLVDAITSKAGFGLS